MAGCLWYERKGIKLGFGTYLIIAWINFGREVIMVRFPLKDSDKNYPFKNVSRNQLNQICSNPNAFTQTLAITMFFWSTKYSDILHFLFFGCCQGGFQPFTKYYSCFIASFEFDRIGSEILLPYSPSPLPLLPLNEYSASNTFVTKNIALETISIKRPIALVCVSLYF